MIVVLLQGGLGNQMFQYAAGLQLATLRNTELAFDLGALSARGPASPATTRGFALDAFGIPERAATSGEVRKFRRLAEPGTRSVWERIEDRIRRRAFFREGALAFDDQVAGLPTDSYLEGYFQDERYFSGIGPLVRSRFDFHIVEEGLSGSARALAGEIRGCAAACIQVRRGDYVINPSAREFHGVCPVGYFRKGLALLRRRTAIDRIYLFSDDPAWCREELGEIGGRVVEDDLAGVDPVVSLHLMAQCRHFVISNSSFGWWGAWLAGGQGKTVIRPVPWFRAPEALDADPCPASWVGLSCDE